MTLNLYVMPIVGTGAKNDERRPKYRDSIFPTLGWGMFDYGNEPQCLVGIVDIPAATDTALTANADVIAAPTNLDQNIGAGATLNRLRSGLEADNIPGTWLTSTTTYRQTVRFVGACCQFMQRYQGSGLPFVFQPGITLDTTFGTLPAATQQGLISAAQSFSFDNGALIAASTLRQILVSVGNQYLATQPPLQMAGVAL